MCSEKLLRFKIIFSLLLVTLTTICFGGNTDTIVVYSRVMRKNIKCVVITPLNYAKGNRHYPVVYLLHGHGGNYAQWPGLAPQLKDKADEMQLIIVCPDGGYSSWYFDSPIDTTFRYETFISSELINNIDASYRTIPARNQRAITGLSMGGHGGLYLSLRHKNVFGAGGSISGGLDIRPFVESWDLKTRLGDTTCCKMNWEHNTVINLVDSLQNNQLQLIIDCGVNDFFLDVNRKFHQKLLGKKIDHDYTERPGGHNNAYWRNSIDYQLLFFRKYFDKL